MAFLLSSGTNPATAWHSFTKETEVPFMRPLVSNGCMISMPRSRAKTSPFIGAIKPYQEPGSRSPVIPTLVVALSDPDYA